MLSIRMQRTGRKGHAMFRLVVQESRLTPTSGKVVAQLGSFDPHSKTVTLDSDKATFYLTHGAQPSGRAAMILQKEGIELPNWVKTSAAKSTPIRHASKLRKNQPVIEPEAPKASEVVAAPEASTASKTETSEAAPDDAPEAETGTVES